MENSLRGSCNSGPSTMRINHLWYIFATLVFLMIIAPAAFAFQAECEVRFSPNGGGEAEVVALIDSAQTDIRVLAYSFTSQPIADALIEAHNRGVDVQIVLDKGQPNAKGGMYREVVAAGIDTRIDRKHAIAHNKVIIVDSTTFETGSFNYTNNAEHSNGENALVCHSTDGAALYLANFKRHQGHSTR